MHNRSYSKTPTIDFAIPPGPPEPIPEANAAFLRVSAELRQTRRDAYELKTTGKKTRIAAAVETAAAAAIAGKKAPDPADAELEILREESALRTRITVLEAAADEAGNRLAELIAEHCDEWQQALDEQAEQAANDYAAALDAAEAALAKFKPCAAAIQWLETFDYGAAIVGQQQQFSGGRADIPVQDARVILPSANALSVDPQSLLAAARKATQPPPEPVTSIDHTGFRR